jgi:hypothetical protein
MPSSLQQLVVGVGLVCARVLWCPERGRGLGAMMHACRGLTVLLLHCRRFGAAGEVTVDLLSRLLTFDPARRCGAEEALSHEYFWGLMEELQQQQQQNNSAAASRGASRTVSAAGAAIAAEVQQQQQQQQQGGREAACPADLLGMISSMEVDDEPAAAGARPGSGAGSQPGSAAGARPGNAPGSRPGSAAGAAAGAADAAAGVFTRPRSSNGAIEELPSLQQQVKRPRHSSLGAAGPGGKPGELSSRHSTASSHYYEVVNPAQVGCAGLRPAYSAEWSTVGAAHGSIHLA